MKSDGKRRTYRMDTLLAHLGRHPEGQHGAVNPPVYHASTILSSNMAEWEAKRDPQTRFDVVRYGLLGTPTTFALEEALAAVEGGYRAMLMSSGLAAITAPLQACLKCGDHLLMVDSAYGPARNFCEKVLTRCGIATTYYDPLIGEEIARLMRPNTKVVYVESPGSLTFEVQDVPAIAAAAHEAGATVLMDNTWASPCLFRSFEHGVDVSIHAATKYIVGHSDVILGAVITNEAMFLPVRTMAADLGHCAAPDDAYYALRGLRTMGVRLERHEKNALAVARWLQSRPEVSRVLYPALPEDPGHELWKRDFLGASGLFGVVLKPASKTAVYAMIDALDLFGIGSSWGGFESLILPTYPERGRTATRWTAEGPTLRLHIGLEDPQDLIEDLERGFHQLRAIAAAA
ncbi:MAG: cystathionine beta-lyase [Alphaproteobacteria bacterium]|nr:MAG: cystathionine beta-lyase [Alphaproteobacteria bacterium]